MAKPWSISTTVRNPDRLRPFLNVLAQLKGQQFDADNQIKYQILLIQAKLYKPTNLALQHKAYFDSGEQTMPYSVAEEIFHSQSYEDPPMRGRQSVNPLNKLGFAVARAGFGPIQITELGAKFLEGDYDIGFVFFKSLLKLQFPNPWSTRFSVQQGFNIMPFVATLRLLRQLEQKSGKSGLTKQEFSVFVPTLIDANHIGAQAEKVLAFRKAADSDTWIRDFASEFYGLAPLPEKALHNLFDYGDNIMRCFRLTRYFKIVMDPTGTHWHLQLEPSRSSEIHQLLGMYDGTAIPFKTQRDYLDYIADIRRPELPWEEINSLRQVATSLQEIGESITKEHGVVLSQPEQSLLVQSLASLSKPQLENVVSQLRVLNTNLRARAKKKAIVDDLSRLRQIIDVLRDTRALRKYDPEHFEKLITEALLIINDEIDISPNYPVDDEGEPISHAPANRPDIECYYDLFNATCEVTLNCGHLQWVHEGQPVMRHLRDFESRFPAKQAFCLFIAPKIHGDTFSTFWTAVRYEYDGTPQKIVPFAASLFATILETLLTLKEQGETLTHDDLRDLYLRISGDCSTVPGYSQWAASIQSLVEQWCEERLHS